jgi:zinc protease
MTTLAVPHLPVHRFELACGAKFLMSPRSGAQICALQVYMHGGHALDPVGLEGTAFLAGGLVDQGTRNLAEGDIASAIEDAGGSLGGNSAGFGGAVAGDRWKTLLEVTAECVSKPTYPRPRFERHKKRLLDRLLVERDDPRTQGIWMFRRLVYGDHWVGRPDYGTMESVARIQRKDVAAYHKRNWCGKRAVIAMCADVDPLKAKRFLDKQLADWKPGKQIARSVPDFPKLAPRTAAFHAKRRQVHVYLGHVGIPRKHPDFPALLVMDHILGTGPGFTNRISRRLRDELGLAYSVSAAISSSAGYLPGTFLAYIGTSPEHLETAVKGFLREIRRIQKERVTKDELALAKSYLTGSMPIGFERAGRRVQELILADRCELSETHLEELVAAIDAVTIDDVRDAARAHLHPEASSLVAAGAVSKRDVARLFR